MLTHKQRKGIRFTIKSLHQAQQTLEDCLRKGKPIPHELITKLSRVVDSSDPETLLRAVDQVHAEMERVYMGQLRDMGRNDLTAYSEYMNPHEPPADWHVWLCERLMAMEAREILRMLISAPPGHAKSQYSSRNFPTWYMGRNARHRYIQAGHTTGFAENEFGKKCKAMIESERFSDVFPDVQLSHDSKAAGYWSLAQPNGGSYLTRGVGQGIAGFRAHCAGIDDPFASREDAESPTIRDKVWDWFSADFTTRLLPNSPMFVVATRWHSDDLVGRIEEMNRKGKGLPWEVVNLPAIATEIDDPMGRAIGEPLWPDFYSYDFLMNLKSTLPARDWNSLYMGKPMDENGGVVSLEWFQRYERIPGHNIRLKTTISVDSANKPGERNDYCAIGVWIETAERLHYLVHVHREQLEFNDLNKKINQLAATWQADAIIVEDKGSGTQYIQLQQDPKTPPELKAAAPVISISTNNQSKEFRMDGVSPMIEGGLVYLPKDATWLTDYETEISGFPNGKYKDQVDMTSQYLAWAKVKKGGVTRKLTGAQHGNSASKDKVKAEIEAHVQARLKIPEGALPDPIHAVVEAARLRAAGPNS